MSFRGASADSFAALQAQLDGLSGSVAATTGTDLFGLAGVLRHEPALRRVATDLSTEAGAKADLVRGVFSGKVSNEALEIIAAAAQSKWTSPSDLTKAVEDLGVIATAKSEESAGGMLSDELFALSQLIDANDELRNALSDPTRSAADKSALLRGLLEGKTLTGTVVLAEQALAGTHRTVGAALSSYQATAAAVRGESQALVRVARPISDADTQRLQAALSKNYGQQIHVDVMVDPELIGGMRVEIGDDVFDGTVSSRLDGVQRKLAG